MSKVRITLTKSKIDRTKAQKLVLESLGLNKIGSSVEKEATPQIMGMVTKVSHLVKTEEIQYGNGFTYIKVPAFLFPCMIS